MSIFSFIIAFVILFLVECLIIKFEIKFNPDLFYSLYRDYIIYVLYHDDKKRCKDILIHELEMCGLKFVDKEDGVKDVFNEEVKDLKERK